MNRSSASGVAEIAAAVHPPVVAGRATQRHVGVAADEDRDRLGGRRGHLRLRDVVELAVEFEVLAGCQALDDRDAFVHPLAASGERHVHQFVVLGPRAGADAESESVVEQRRQRAGLLGDQRGRTDRQLEDEHVELQRRRRRAQRAGQMNASMISLPSRNSRPPSSVYGYFESDS